MKFHYNEILVFQWIWGVWLGDASDGVGRVVSIAHGPVPGHFPFYINQQNTRAVGVEFSAQ